MVCFDDENASANMYVRILVTVRVQASQLPWQAEVTVLKGMICKIFHKPALKTSMNHLKYHWYEI